MKILIYVRPFTEKYLCAVIENAFPDAKYQTICDFKGCGDIWMGEYLYKKTVKQAQVMPDRKTIEDIRLRCRFLQKEDPQKARELIRRYWSGIWEILSNNQFDLVYGEMIDNYCMDIIERIAAMKGVTVFGVVGTFYAGHSTFTIRGEYRKCRDNVTLQEIKDIKETMLKPNFRGVTPADKKRNTKRLLRQFYRRKLIESFYYPLKKLIEKDPYNYHYNTIYYKGWDYRKYFGKNVDRLFVKASSVTYTPNSIYVPLQMLHEATTDYWGDHPKFGNTEKVILDVIKKSDKSITFLVKEHPVMYGWRNIDYYKKLLENNNVVLIDPYENNASIVNHVDNILVCTGTTGVEGLLKGKRVLTLTENYYSSFHPNIHKVDLVTEKDLEIPIVDYDGEIFLEDILKAMIPVQMYEVRQWKKINIPLLARCVREYYFRLKEEMLAHNC